MSRLRRYAVTAGVVAGACVFCAPSTASAADEDTIVGITSITLGSMLVGADIAFTAYTASRVSDNKEPAQAWMIAQSVLTSAQTVAINGLAIWLDLEDDDEEGAELLTLIPSIWVGTLATFSTWTLARPGDESLDARMGLSFVAATNLAFTSTAIGSFADDGHSPYYLSIPQTALMAPQSVLTAIQAARDESGRPGWIALSAWSGVLAIHGVVSLVTRAMDRGSSEPLPDVQTPLPPPTAPAVDPYYIDPTVPPAGPPLPAPAPTPAPLVVPAPVPDAAGIAPGLSVVGLF